MLPVVTDPPVVPFRIAVQVLLVVLPDDASHVGCAVIDEIIMCGVLYELVHQAALTCFEGHPVEEFDYVVVGCHALLWRD